MTFRIAVDVGGTFTDLVSVDPTGNVVFVKVASTPHDQAVGFMHGMERLSEEHGLSVSGLLAKTERIVHGMTVATNALLERKGASVGLLTTQGHRDVLEMREGLKPQRYDMRLPRVEPLVPRRLRLGVRERLRADGRVEIPLDPASLASAIDVLQEAGVSSVAVCYLHAYRDAAHEQATREAVESAMPGVHVSLSSDVLPQIKEFERVSTTVVNAYVAPLIGGYLAGLQRHLSAAGFTGPLLIMFSHGGVAPVEEAVRIAAGTVLSGPAGGLAGGRRATAMLDAPDLITFDVGGTSTDISLIVNGEATLSKDRTMANERIAMPSLDIVTLGAGGGSIARVEAGGLLEVGPHSAGAVPGPVCYRKGGTEPTVTDASVVLGFLDPDNFAGGRTKLDRDAALAAFQRLGDRLGIDALQAAEGVHRVVNTQMAEGIRMVTVRRGVDPRRFGLLGFGGAAGMHVTALARMLDLRRVLVPRVASVLSAWGMLTTELRLESVHSHIGETDALDLQAVRDLYDGMAREGQARMAGWFDGRIETRRSAEMRYGEQIFEIEVGLDDIDLEDAEAMTQLKNAFERRHEALYTYSLAQQQPVLVNARVTTVGVLPELPVEPTVGTTSAKADCSQRQIYLGAWTAADVFVFDELAAGQIVEGPALIESDSTTVLLRPGDRATTTPQRWLDIEVAG